MKNKYAAAVLAIFLGIFGVHNFYLGKKGEGIIFLLLTVFGLYQLSLVFSVIEFVYYLAVSKETFDKKFNKDFKKCQYCQSDIDVRSIICPRCNSQLVTFNAPCQK